MVWPSKSLEDMVSNLVKNWEKEASYKLEAEDWRTINPSIYTYDACTAKNSQDMQKLPTQLASETGAQWLALT